MTHVLAAGTNLPSWFGGAVIGPLIVLTLSGLAAFYLKTRNQLAVLQDRSDHERDDDGGSGHIEDLRNQIEAQREEIDELRRELREERAARERQELRHNREMTDLNDQLGSVNARLAVARQRLSGLDGQV